MRNRLLIVSSEVIWWWGKAVCIFWHPRHLCSSTNGHSALQSNKIRSGRKKSPIREEACEAHFSTVRETKERRYGVSLVNWPVLEVVWIPIPNRSPASNKLNMGSTVASVGCSFQWLSALFCLVICFLFPFGISVEEHKSRFTKLLLSPAILA